MLTSIAKIIAKLHPNAGLFQYAKAVRKRWVQSQPFVDPFKHFGLASNAIAAQAGKNVCYVMNVRMTKLATKNNPLPNDELFNNNNNNNDNNELINRNEVKK